MIGKATDHSTIRTEIVMGTTVTIHIVAAESSTVDAAVDRAFGWFHEIETRCTRFSATSELMQLTVCVGEPVRVSHILYEAIRFALLIARETEGAFDPAIGHRMAARGFNREHRTGQIVDSPGSTDLDDTATWRDVQLDPENRTIRLLRPLTLDLGAVAKGLAVDTAARELQPFRNFAIDAGGDLYLSGTNPEGRPWSVGIRHPRLDGELIDSVNVSDQAVCTSGDYERRSNLDDHEHHILDPRLNHSPHTIASATVIASSAMLADALATAAFVLGPEQGIQLLERSGVSGLLVTPYIHRYETRGFLRAA